MSNRDPGDHAPLSERIRVISASAGSGKTYRLTEVLEEEIASRRVRAHAVLATTFTNKAAAELQERVRIRLLQNGYVEEAQQLSVARIGTVNSVCSRLVSDFAFELGLSPELRVLDERSSNVAIGRAMSAALTDDDQERLSELQERMVEFDGRGAIGRIVELARSNGISPEQLPDFAVISWEECRKLYDTAGASATELDSALVAAVRTFEAKRPATDNTKVTAAAVDRAGQVAWRLEHDLPVAWKEWVSLAKLPTGKASREAAEAVRVAAAAHDQHPRLLHDLESAIRLVFDQAARTLRAYQEHKRSLGAIDFIDQETLALRLLETRSVREQLADEIDLVLVDEFQDTSPLQLAIFLRLAEIADQSVWVGDQKQAIYAFRGTDPALMDAAIERILGNCEPESLSKSWRSRHELVHLTSAVFAPAFACQGIPEHRVKLEPATPSEPSGLGHCVERWLLGTNDFGGEEAAIASAVNTLLLDKTTKVRDRRTAQPREPRASDIAILCRTNAGCERVAEALAAKGVRPVVPRKGLIATLEGRATLAGLQLWVDTGDRLAAAELARLVQYPGREEQWLADAIAHPDAKAFTALQQITSLRSEREYHSTAGVVRVFDLVLRSLEIRHLCRRWGDAEARLANIEALRGHVHAYAASCITEVAGCTPAGLVEYLQELAESGEDSQGVNEDDHAVVVSTWHGAKGLEWPIVVLWQLEERDSALAALRIHAVSARPAIDLAEPLADRFPPLLAKSVSLWEHRCPDA